VLTGETLRGSRVEDVEALAAWDWGPVLVRGRVDGGPPRGSAHLGAYTGGTRRIERSQLQDALIPASGSLELSLDDALYLLEVTGVVRIEGADDDPIRAYPIASLLNLYREPAKPNELTAKFLDDLAWLLARLHRSSLDFFRPSREATFVERGPRLVPESVFTDYRAPLNRAAPPIHCGAGPTHAPQPSSSAA